MARIELAKYTEKIRSKLPFWFEMKKQPNESLGLQFLNTFGLQLDDIEKILEYAYQQTRIDALDEKFVDICYRHMLPTYFDVKTIKMVKAGSGYLEKADNLYVFLGLEKTYGLTNPIKQPDYYFVDETRKIIYVREDYDKARDIPFGKITVVYGEDEEEMECQLSLHHLWNFFDEFGALLGCPRLFGERNQEYKERILDVFRNPANSTKKGLANGIARELGIRNTLIWEEPDATDFIIKDKMVIANSIKVGNTVISLDDVCVTTDGYLLIKSIPYMTEKNVEVSYIKGLELVALNDHNNIKFTNEVYNPDGSPTELLLHYVDVIKSNSSVLWGDFCYDEGMWVKNDEEFTTQHFQFIPAMLDSKISGFAKYGYMHNGKVIK